MYSSSSSITRNAEPLTVTTVEVWAVALDFPSIVSSGAQLLSAQEHQRANRFVRDLDRRRFIAARGALRRILAGKLGCEPKAVQIESGGFSKPKLSAEQSRGLEFSISHSDDLALISISDSAPVGVDVEKIDRIDVEAMLPHVMTVREQSSFDGLSPEMKQRMFYAIWTAKEAALKVTGLGLSKDPREVEISQPRNLLIRPGTVHSFAPGDLKVMPLPVPQAFQAAVASTMMFSTVLKEF